MRYLLTFALICAACGGGDDHESYLNLQACFDDHHDVEGYAPPQAITICTLDHPIAGSLLDFATAAQCVAYVDSNLADASATAVEIQAGCDDYILQKDR